MVLLIVARATEELALLNEVYTDVLVKDKTRRLYNQVVAFRKVSSRCLMLWCCRMDVVYL